ncbi:capping complex subunit for YIEGIA [Anaerobacillus sp. MEB173]|uniref:capping complex subunit for YIEGIA n=1 Tax=Anaerobacillus sp. MEB173 TaxID=3383345 RepID=UPI003F8E4476
MELDKFILAVVTTKREKVSGSVVTFHCDTKDEMEVMLSTLEAITDGIAHEISEELFIVVKH